MEWTRITEAEPEIAAIQAYAPGVGILKGDYIGDGLVRSYGTGYSYQITHWQPIDAGPTAAPKSN